MPALMGIGSAYLLRPLLALSRAEILAYAGQQGLQWIEDESNAEQRFDRNYMRHQIIPSLTARWPSALTTISRSARHCAEADQLLNELAQIDLSACMGSKPKLLSINALLQLTPMRQRLLLRYWLKYLQLPIPSVRKILTLPRRHTPGLK